MGTHPIFESDFDCLTEMLARRLTRYGPIRALAATQKLQNHEVDICVVGGGIIGLATAQALTKRHPDLKLTVVEKENELAIHQSGSNSGVIHAGIYYVPGSLKAQLCVKGLEMMYAYCDEHNLPYKKCGKLIVATREEELPRLDALWDRAIENGCEVTMVDADGIKEIEPHCVGLRAIHSPKTGIIDYQKVSRHYAKMVEEAGHQVWCNYEVASFDANDATESDFPIAVKSQDGRVIHAKHVVTCAGLHSDRVAAKSGAEVIPKIVPFRGDYLLLKPDKAHWINGNIYPVPDPDFPFLGVHYTPRMNGDIWLGPNAVLALDREGYNLTSFNLKDCLEIAKFSGIYKLVFRNIRAGMGELWRTFNLNAQVKDLQRFVPELKRDDVMRGPAGVRAQAMNYEGNLVDDFIFDQGTGPLASRMLHVRNAPSPACTASLAIAEMVVDEIEQKLLHMEKELESETN